MKTSYARTKTTSFRTEEVTERSQSPTSDDWKPYISRLILSVYPNRIHFIVKSPILESDEPREIIWLGDKAYAANASGKWRQRDLKTGTVTNPSSGSRFRDFYFPAEISKCYSESGTCFRVVGWPVPRSKQDDKKLVRWTVWFDEAGMLSKYESIGFNHVDWSRTTWVYEYDSTISVQAPPM